MAQQTAVDWYYQQTVIEGKTNYWELLEQAKQMEKEQIMNAVERGFNVGLHRPRDRFLKNAEQYYNETYGTTK